MLGKLNFMGFYVKRKFIKIGSGCNAQTMLPVIAIINQYGSCQRKSTLENTKKKGKSTIGGETKTHESPA